MVYTFLITLDPYGGSTWGKEINFHLTLSVNPHCPEDFSNTVIKQMEAIDLNSRDLRLSITHSPKNVAAELRANVLKKLPNNALDGLEGSIAFLLISKKEIEGFDGNFHPYIIITYDGFFDSAGQLNLIEFMKAHQIIPKMLIQEDPFGAIKNAFEEQKESHHSAIEIKPGVWGVSVDLKKMLQVFKKN